MLLNHKDNIFYLLAIEKILLNDTKVGPCSEWMKIKEDDTITIAKYTYTIKILYKQDREQTFDLNILRPIINGIDPKLLVYVEIIES